MDKFLKYGISAVVAIFILINSINIKKLDKVWAAEKEANFDAADYAQNFWDQQRTTSLEQAVSIDQLFSRLEENFDSTAVWGEQVGISDYRYFMIRGAGTIKEILKDDVVVGLDESHHIKLATGFIFDNTVRNAVPQIVIDEFVNMTQFNQVSIQINKLVQNNVVPTLKEQAQVGRSLSFAGAISLNVETRELDSLRVIPLRINIGEE